MMKYKQLELFETKLNLSVEDFLKKEKIPEIFLWSDLEHFAELNFGKLSYYIAESENQKLCYSLYCQNKKSFLYMEEFAYQNIKNIKFEEYDEVLFKFFDLEKRILHKSRIYYV